MDVAEGALRKEIIRQSSAFELSALVEAIGTPAFSSELLCFLNRETGVEHYACSSLATQSRGRSSSTASPAASSSSTSQLAISPAAAGARSDDRRGSTLRIRRRGDPASPRGRPVAARRPSRSHLWRSQRPRAHHDLRRPAKRSARSLRGAQFADGRFDRGNLRRIRHAAGTLLALVGKHAELAERLSRTSATLTSLVEIERNIPRAARNSRAARHRSARASSTACRAAASRSISALASRP